MTSAPNSIKQACVSAYKDAGFRLFACKGPYAPTADEYKRPVNTGWQDENMPAHLLPDVFGVSLTDEIMVLDYDPRRDPAGGSSLSALWKHLQLPDANTFIVRSASGGFHVYFRKPAELHLRNRVPGFDAIDIKTGGGYVIAAGATGITGEQYGVVRGSPSVIMAAPVALLDYVQLLRRTDWQTEATSDDTDTIRRFTTYCQRTEAAVEGNGGDGRTYLVACTGKDFGLSDEATLNVMAEHFNPRCSPPWSDDELTRKVANAYQYSQNAQGYLNADATLADAQVDVPAGQPPKAKEQTENKALRESLANTYNSTINFTWQVDKQGVKRFDPTLNNVLSFLRLMPTDDKPQPLYKLLRWNQFKNAIEFVGPAPWHDEWTGRKYLEDLDVIFIKEYLINVPIHVGVEVVREACRILAHENRYEPGQDWLNGLKWDGVPRIDTMLIDYAGAADTPINREFTKNSMIAAVARRMNPGCKHDSMLVLEGDQDLGKSTFISVLGGEDYGSPKMDPGSKDTLCKTMGLWFIEMAELEALRRTEVSSLRAWLTVTEDIDRLPFERIASVHPRRFVLWGTINPDKGGAGYLPDQTGNRRFWPVLTTKIDIPGLKAVREQLFAEAMARYSNGEHWWIEDPALKQAARDVQSNRQTQDEWEDSISNWLAKSERLPALMTTDLIALHALGLTPGNMDQTESRRIGNAMRKLGYEKKAVRIKDKVFREWKPIVKVDNCEWL